MVTVHRVRDKKGVPFVVRNSAYLRELDPLEWSVSRGDKEIGWVNQYRGKFQAFVYDSCRHYSATLGNVAACAKWIELRAPKAA